jgi:hypothetical protein
MEKFIAQRNIAHFEALPKNEPDASERRILESMLREQRAKLAAAEAQPRAATSHRGPTSHRATPDVDPIPC